MIVANHLRCLRICGRRVALFALALAVALTSAPAIAQTGASATAETGFRPNRDYFSLQPWESIDTASGNLVLTFADLVLPGNGGGVRFERVYNNRVTGRDKTWRFSVSGLPVSVTHGLEPSRGREMEADRLHCLNPRG